MTNQTFNFNRYALTLRKELVENKKQLLIIVLCLFLGLSFLMFIGNWVFEHSNISIHQIRSVAIVTVMGTFGTVISIMASLMFNGLKDKPERVSHLMSPATTLEKFLVQVTIYFVGGILAFFFCAQLADLVRIGLMNLFSGSLILPPINFVTGIFNIKEWGFPLSLGEMGVVITPWVMVVSFVFSFTFYMLGAVLWPKLSFLKTFAASYVLQMFLGIAFLAFLAVGDLEDVVLYMKNSFPQFFVVMAVIYAVLIVVTVVAAYWLYKRKDVVKNSWL